jgi:hypothetical protein
MMFEQQSRLLLYIRPLGALAARSILPFTYSPLIEVASGVAQQFLFHSLLALLLRSICVENHMRLMQMETALVIWKGAERNYSGNEIDCVRKKLLKK